MYLPLVSSCIVMVSLGVHTAYCSRCLCSVYIVWILRVSGILFWFGNTGNSIECWLFSLSMQQSRRERSEMKHYVWNNSFDLMACLNQSIAWKITQNDFKRNKKINGWQWLFCPNEDTCENPFFIRGKSVKQKTHAHTGTNHSHVWSSVIRKRIRKWFTLVYKNKANGKWKTENGHTLFVLIFRFLSSISWFWIVYQIFYKTVSAQRVLATWIHIDCRADVTTALMYSRGCDGDDDCDHNDDRNCNCCTNSFSQSDCHRFYAFWLKRERQTSSCQYDDDLFQFIFQFSSVEFRGRYKEEKTVLIRRALNRSVRFYIVYSSV